jgi:hypothetical protein
MDLERFIKELPEWSELRVWWRDAHSPSSGWHDTSDYEPDESVAITLGRVWHNVQEHYVTLVGTIFESELPNPETVGDINHIPYAWLIKVELIGKDNTNGY